MDAPKNKRRWPKILAAFLLLIIAGTIYVWCNPLIFNESFWGHAHCIKQSALGLRNYADSHGGRFPTDLRGYGNALLRLDENLDDALTGPGYDSSAFQFARNNGTLLAEKDCGRVYIQGLTALAGPKVAILFDKRSTPGGDHCHLFARFIAPLGREVAYTDGFNDFIPDSDWPAFVQTQIALLTAAGIPPEEALRLYDSALD